MQSSTLRAYDKFDTWLKLIFCCIGMIEAEEEQQMLRRQCSDELAQLGVEAGTGLGTGAPVWRHGRCNSPALLATLPKMFADSPYAACDGLVGVSSAAPAARRPRAERRLACTCREAMLEVVLGREAFFMITQKLPGRYSVFSWRTQLSGLNHFGV
jgi:hypothetical protein